MYAFSWPNSRDFFDTLSPSECSDQNQLDSLNPPLIMVLERHYDQASELKPSTRVRAML